MRKSAGVAVLTLLLGACGGGGGSDSATPSTTPAPSPASPPPVAGMQGRWDGAITNGLGAISIVLENGDYWTIYGPKTDHLTLIYGILQGNSRAFSADPANSKTTYPEETGVDVSIAGANFSFYLTPGSTGQYKTANTFTAVAHYQNGAANTLTANYVPDATQSSLASIAGNYSGSFILKNYSGPASVSIDAAGVIKGVSVGCQFTGAATAHPGSNVYDIQVTQGSSPCLMSGVSSKGIGFVDKATNFLNVVTLDASRSNPFIFAGIKK